MRVTIDENDPDYVGKSGRWLTVFLNGRELRDCIEADDVRGTAVVYARDDDGKLMFNRERDELVRLSVQGRIEIIAFAQNQGR